MIEDMTARSFDPHTQSGYIHAVKKLAAFLGHSPDKASAEDMRRLQIHLRDTGVSAPTVKIADLGDGRHHPLAVSRSGGGIADCRDRRDRPSDWGIRLLAIEEAGASRSTKKPIRSGSGDSLSGMKRSSE
jgi:hypothetical protein